MNNEKETIINVLTIVGFKGTKKLATINNNFVAKTNPPFSIPINSIR